MRRNRGIRFCVLRERGARFTLEMTLGTVELGVRPADLGQYLPGNRAETVEAAAQRPAASKAERDGQPATSMRLQQAVGGALVEPRTDSVSAGWIFHSHLRAAQAERDVPLTDSFARQPPTATIPKRISHDSHRPFHAPLPRPGVRHRTAGRKAPELPLPLPRGQPA